MGAQGDHQGLWHPIHPRGAKKIKGRKSKDKHYCHPNTEAENAGDTKNTTREDLEKA